MPKAIRKNEEEEGGGRVVDVVDNNDATQTTTSLKNIDQTFIRQLFKDLDTDEDGKIEPKELQTALSDRLHIPANDKQLEEIMWLCDLNKDGKIDYKEFAEFVLAKEGELKTIFDSLDENNDGKIDADEITRGLKKAYSDSIDVDPKVVRAMVDLIDSDHDGSITFPEWQHFLALIPPPSSSKQESRPYAIFVFDYWKKAAIVDIGENVSVPINRSRGQWWNYVLAGGLAGGVSRTATAPLDRLKTVMQLQHKSHAKVTLSKVIARIWQEGNIRGFFRGNGANCIKIVPESSIKFFVYEKMKDVLSKRHSDSTISIAALSDFERFIAGATAGALSQFAIYPLECIKTRLAAPSSPYKGIIDVFLSSARSKDGVLSLYRGLTPSLIGIIPYAGIDLAVYEYLRARYFKLIEKDGETSAHLAAVAPLICGTLSSSVAQLVSYPLGLVRTRLQAQGIQSAKSGEVVVYSGMIDAFKKTVQQEGFLGLYRGILPNYLKVIPAVSISYAVYENMKKYFGV